MPLTDDRPLLATLPPEVVTLYKRARLLQGWAAEHLSPEEARSATLTANTVIDAIFVIEQLSRAQKQARETNSTVHAVLDMEPAGPQMLLKKHGVDGGQDGPLFPRALEKDKPLWQHCRVLSAYFIKHNIPAGEDAVSTTRADQAAGLQQARPNGREIE